MEHFVTLFDAAFLPQGLALHRSLRRHAGDFTLWRVCVDEAAYDQADVTGEFCVQFVVFDV